MHFSYWFLLFALALFAYTFIKRIETGWHVRWSQGTPKRPAIDGSGWSIEVPMQGRGHLNDVLFHFKRSILNILRFRGESLKGAKSITIRGHITGDGFTIMENFDPATHPPTATLMLQRYGDKPRDEPKYWVYRLYSREMIPLQAGDFEMTIPLTVDSFTAVKGKPDAAQFAKALDSLLGFAIVFGSAGGRAHGVCTSTAARFTLRSFTINR